VVPVLFHYSIAPSKSGLVPKLDDKSSEEHTKIASPPTSNEVALALQVLEGCCLLDRDSRTLAQQHMAIKVDSKCQALLIFCEECGRMSRFDIHVLLKFK
jgi:hypothetical protein